MVQRNSQEAQLGSAGSTRLQQSGMGFAQPDADAFAETRSITNALNVAGGSTERILSNILGVAGKLGEQAVAQSREEAYLAGSAAVGVKDSEEQLQGSVFTRNWAKAGFRDTTGRLAAADAQAKIAADMPKMREKSPEEFAQYLAEQRTPLLASYEGMTLDTRKTMFAQQMMNDRAAIQKHGSEHAKFVIDTEQRSLQAASYVTFNALDTAKSDAETYKAATQAAFMTGYSAIVQNPKLPPENKSKLLSEFAEAALSRDHQALFLMMQNDKITLPDGTKGPMMSAVSFDDQIKTSNLYRESLKRTEAFRATKYMDDQAAMRADWANPATPLMPLDKVRSFLADGTQRNFVNADQYQSIMKEYYTAQEKKAASADLATAYAAGDIGKMLKLDKTPTEGLDAFIKQSGRTMTVPELTSKLMTIGLITGQENAFKKVGEILAPAVVSLGLRENIDPNQAASIAGVLQQVESAKSHGLEGAESQFLSAFSPEAQAKISYMRDSLKTGMDPVSATAMAAKRVADEAAMTPAMRAELSASKAKELNAAVAEITPRGLWSSAVLYTESLVSADAAAEVKLRPFSAWFENPTRVSEVMATGRLELSKKMDSVSRNNPGMSSEAVKSMALADISNRTVATDWGPLVVPDGFTPQRYFGVDTQVPNDRIASAMQEYIKPQEGNRMAFSVGLSGELVAKELNDKGQLVGSKTFDPKVIKPLVDQQQAKYNQRFNINQGAGMTKRAGDLSVTFNGANSANVEPAWMRQYREDLVDHEGVRDVPYADASGKIVDGKPVQTVGVGVSSHSKYYPKIEGGKLTPEQINQSFIAASNGAAQVGQRAMLATGTVSESSFRLFSSLAYQSGESFAKLPVYNTMLKAIGSNNYEAAHAALVQSPAYRMSHEARRKYYEDQLKAAMKG